MPPLTENPSASPDPANRNIQSGKDALLAAADRCVMCGLCLPHCPTYGLTHTENESPRGRLALIQATLSGRLPAGERVRGYLDHCLLCRACEAMCPSRVPFGEIMDAARAAFYSQEKLNDHWKKRFVRQLALKRSLRAWTARLFILYRRLGLRWLARRSGLLRLLDVRYEDQLLPQVTAPAAWRPAYPAIGTQRGRVALFTGCLSEITERDVLASTIHVLTRLGYEVVVPGDQACCGAIHYHEGDVKTAQQLSRQNLDAFSDSGIDAIITIASGCGAQLTEYPHTLAQEPVLHARAGAFSGRVREVCRFLAEQDWPEDLALANLDARVAVHEPCTHRNVLGGNQAVAALLGRIPGIDAFPLPENRTCCGGAGHYLVAQPGFASGLRAGKTRCLEKANPDIVVTTNTGCRIQLSAKNDGREYNVLHPVQLIHEQLQ
jgi:glycolate oxidase iron-sulfur subunit